jgi:hypothetical protein
MATHEGQPRSMFAISNEAQKSSKRTPSGTELDADLLLGKDHCTTTGPSLNFRL